MGDAAGRVLWGIVTAAWPGVLVLRSEFSMHWWHAGLTWAVALAEAGCALALRARQRRQERARQQAAEAERRQEAEERLSDLEERVGAYERALAVVDAYAHRRRPDPAPRRLSPVPPLRESAR